MFVNMAFCSYINWFTSVFISEKCYGPESETIADDGGVDVDEHVVTDCSPLTVVIHYQTSFGAAVTSHQSDSNIWTSSMYHYHGQLRLCTFRVASYLGASQRWVPEVMSLASRILEDISKVLDFALVSTSKFLALVLASAPRLWPWSCVGKSSKCWRACISKGRIYQCCKEFH